MVGVLSGLGFDAESAPSDAGVGDSAASLLLGGYGCRIRLLQVPGGTEMEVAFDDDTLLADLRERLTAALGRRWTILEIEECLDEDGLDEVTRARGVLTSTERPEGRSDQVHQAVTSIEHLNRTSATTGVTAIEGLPPPPASWPRVAQLPPPPVRTPRARPSRDWVCQLGGVLAVATGSLVLVGGILPFFGAPDSGSIFHDPGTWPLWALGGFMVVAGAEAVTRRRGALGAAAGTAIAFCALQLLLFELLSILRDLFELFDVQLTAGLGFVCWTVALGTGLLTVLVALFGLGAKPDEHRPGVAVGLLALPSGGLVAAGTAGLFGGPRLDELFRDDLRAALLLTLFPLACIASALLAVIARSQGAVGLIGGVGWFMALVSATNCLHGITSGLGLSWPLRELLMSLGAAWLLALAGGALIKGSRPMLAASEPCSTTGWSNDQTVQVKRSVVTGALLLAVSPSVVVLAGIAVLMNR
ncbi:hypothetical protein [Rhabdothermincola sediminis]|uniref:hypothetical protein n=1 Tax=Rhabdothermincola sediminis TaxID=2751370 RepID=UPI001AA03011|nr:hypothetical protein [Rhabdothermincola sediminis]